MRSIRRQNHHWRPGVLRRLGVYGLDQLEAAYLAGLAIAEPILLVGGVGQAKTMLVEQTARALRLRFCAYSAEKAMFEDILGPFDPRAMYEGRVDYLRTEITIWDKEMILIDELSRANPAMQNKWLEVIRSRRVMGKSLENLRYVIAAMNPPGLLGTLPLDEALAGRFTFILPFPDIFSMNEADQRRVVESRSKVDGIGLGEDVQEELFDLERLLDAIRDEYRAINKDLLYATTTYVLKVAEYLASKDIKLDGRRLGMMERGLIAIVAAEHVLKNIRVSPRLPSDLYRKGLEMTLPFLALGKQITQSRLDRAHEHATAALEGKAKRILPLSDLLCATRMLISQSEAWKDSDLTSMLISRIGTTLEHPTRTETAVHACAAMMVLATRPEMLAKFRPEARHRLLACWREVCSIAPAHQTEFMDQLFSINLDTNLEERALIAALRCAFTLSKRLNRASLATTDFEQVVTMLVRALENGGAA